MPCIKQKEDDIEINLIRLHFMDGANNVIYFPTEASVANIINFIFKNKKNKVTLTDEEQNTLIILKTMVKSWQDSSRYLSGVVVDSSALSKKEKKEIGKNTAERIISTLCLGDIETGMLEGLVESNFHVSILLAAITDSPIILSTHMLENITFQEGDEEGKLELIADDNENINFDEEDDIDFDEDEDGEGEGEDVIEKTKQNLTPIDKNISKIANEIININSEKSKNELKPKKEKVQKKLKGKKKTKTPKIPKK